MKLSLNPMQTALHQRPRLAARCFGFSNYAARRETEVILRCTSCRKTQNDTHPCPVITICTLVLYLPNDDRYLKEIPFGLICLVLNQRVRPFLEGRNSLYRRPQTCPINDAIHTHSRGTQSWRTFYNLELSGRICSDVVKVRHMILVDHLEHFVKVINASQISFGCVFHGIQNLVP
ncbi:hypothetical protein BC830DRAFT_527124 [Chytriomyces sp. MP71]|nr:hypothetical protein BC830DRAFT_527124 [Chytriomyces sp. MP71]